MRHEVTANPVSSTGQALCLGAKSAVQEKVNNFFTQLAGRQAEIKQRCRTVLQARAEGLLGKAHADGVVPIFDSNLILSKSPAQPMQAHAHATGYGLVPKRQRPTCEQTSTR